ncbi:hypothetical protein IIV25_071R [Invertebrate iridovirus 25]|uniref:Uncharacterized protein n=1 Tax=Invertebrate iridovirus 25 TaxID=1301280 RepID=W8W2T3_9VIRU|nr:hypothetical protein IIV25_071R [Invertebrate iridovirus 25]CCV02089.1 hypothetical protein IIV25_071R [Invertebrate iridovirus 25]
MIALPFILLVLPLFLQPVVSDCYCDYDAGKWNGWTSHNRNTLKCCNEVGLSTYTDYLYTRSMCDTNSNNQQDFCRCCKSGGNSYSCGCPKSE